EMKAAGSIYKNRGKERKVVEWEMEGVKNKYKIEGGLVQEEGERYDELGGEKGKDNGEREIQARCLNDGIAVDENLGREVEEVRKEYERL
uniref:hypothetical protein n=1 Tax=Bacillus subtilis TaxID=1423 RepID=UPI001642729B